MENATPRFALPQLVVAQAHKEITHNEALALVDALLHPVVETILSAPPSVANEDAGKCWLVGLAATGVFAGKSNRIAYWNGSSWRFILASEGMRLWHRGDQCVLYFIDGQWFSLSAVTLPVGGAVVDQEARLALADLVDRLEEIGILPTA